MCKLKSKRQKIIFLNIIIVLCWAGIVFMFSNQNAEKSDGLSLPIADSLIRIIHKDKAFTEQELILLRSKYDHYVRKTAHFVVYMLGGIAIITFIKSITDKTKLSVLVTVLLGFLYASSDELHQYFVAGRGALFSDVLLDTTGVITGIIIYLIIIRKVRKGENEIIKKTQKCVTKNN